MEKLKGKNAFITGAAMGNGKGIAKVLAKHGATIFLIDISEKVYETANEFKSKGYNANPCIVDVTKYDKIREAVNKIIEKYNRIDILVNNAGVIKLKSFLETTDEIRDYHFNININGVWNCTKAILPSMIEQKYGKIVNMSSVTGPMVADEGEVAYATSKAAIWGFTKGLAREVAKHNITVNAICPGYVLTPMVQGMANEVQPDNPQKVIDEIANPIPMKRLADIEEIGELAAFLSSDESTYITGTQIVIDGGSTLPETVTISA